MEHLNLDPFFLSRVQFAFTMSFHIIFPAFTIGLSSWLTVVELLWLKTNNPVYRSVYQFWVKIFAVAFGMGVVSGIVMSYQFGTNWAGFSEKIGNVLGPLFGFEVLTAFFLESSFLGIMLFGWNRVSPRMHFVSTFIVAIGTLISAFWILSANSWMHTPTGYAFKEGVFYPTDWISIIFNPSFMFRYAHMVTAAYLTTAFTVSGTGAWYLWRQKHLPQAKVMMGMGMLMIAFVAPLQIVLGDLHGLNTFKHQPIKVAAMEGLWETQKQAPLTLFAIPDTKHETNHFAIEVPNLSSLILTHHLDGEVTGLKAAPQESRPPIGIVFFSFRIMVGIGILMLLTGILATYLFFKKRLFTSRWFQKWCVLMIPSGFIAVLSGWFVTEVGRQPFIVYNLMRTSEIISPVRPEYVLMSLLAFIVIYTFIFGAGTYYIIRLIVIGPHAIKIEGAERFFGQPNLLSPTSTHSHY